MIFVKRDLALVDDDILEAATAASAALDAIADPKDRKTFIEENSGVWSAFRPALLKMSHNKCWYSEAFEAVSRYQVDHFRPKGRARVSQTQYSDGYSWLAFEPSNYVLAGALCNQMNREYSEITVGKGSWFPLYDPTVAANLANRNCSAEAPVLLDPTLRGAGDVLEFNEDGEVHPRSDLAENYRQHVDWAINLLGIRHGQLNEARRQHRKQCLSRIRIYKGIARKAPPDRSAEETENLGILAIELMELSSSKAPFSAAFRAQLTAENLSQLIVRDELV